MRQFKDKMSSEEVESLKQRLINQTTNFSFDDDKPPKVKKLFKYTILLGVILLSINITVWFAFDYFATIPLVLWTLFIGYTAKENRSLFKEALYEKAATELYQENVKRWLNRGLYFSITRDFQHIH